MEIAGKRVALLVEEMFNRVQAGSIRKDRKAVMDGNQITSRTPDDLP